MDKLEVGQIVNTHGLKGEVKITHWCDYPEVFEKLSTIYFSDKAYKIQSVKYHKNSIILKLSGIDTIEMAEKLRNTVICASREELALDGEYTYYVRDLLGLTVYSNGEILGELTDWFPTGSNDVYVVRTEEGKNIMVPAIRQVVKKVDLKEKFMEVELLEGLLDED